MPPPSGKNGPSRRDHSAALALVERLQGALRHGDRAQIVALLRGLVDLRAPMADQWQQLAYIAADHGELSLGREAMELFVEAAGGGAGARYQQFGFLSRIGAWDRAREALEALPGDMPDPAINAYSRGTMNLLLDRPGEARQVLERATELRPELAQAWLPLSTLIDFAAEPEAADRFVAAASRVAPAPPPARAIYDYALGKVHADRREHGLAFEAVARGAATLKSVAPYSREQDRASAEEAVRGYSPEAIAALSHRQQERTDRTLFVMGLPRSGTTLVEQILASHGAVADGAEFNRLRMLAQEIGGAGLAEVERHVAEHGAGPGARLWAHWLEERFPGADRVVDKSIDTSRYLGLAAALLPDAPLIWLTRDPLDCAWSCFRTHFLAGVPWSHDLEDIAHHFRLEDELLARWQEILGERLLVVPYEALVTEPDDWIRRILGHCGLEVEPQVFAPHENRRAVTTSSVMQVRRPINRNGIGSAEPYREFMAPFLEAYGT